MCRFDGYPALDKCLQARYPGRVSIVPADVKAPRQFAAGVLMSCPGPGDYQARRAGRSLSGQVLRVQFAGGPPVHEAVWLHRDFINVRRGEVTVEAQVKGKGGKPRTVEIDRRLLSRLDLSSPFPLRALRKEATAGSRTKRRSGALRTW